MTNLPELTWIFGHGSLMFAPGFAHEEARHGRAHGWERRFGQPSVRNWGRPGSPAPTCSLTRGSYCDGIAFGIGPGDRGSVLEQLIKREAGDPLIIPVDIGPGDVDAYTWVMGSAWNDRGVSRLVEAAMINISTGGGPQGDAWDYVSGVERALSDWGLNDPLVTEYHRALQLRRSQGSPDGG